MNKRIAELAQMVLATDTFPLPIRETCTNEKEKEDPIAVAMGLRRYLMKQTVEIRSGELLGDRYRFTGIPKPSTNYLLNHDSTANVLAIDQLSEIHGGCEYPSDFYKCAGHSHKSDAYNRCNHVSHPNDLYYWGWTHVSLDFGYILTNGLEAYKERIDKAIVWYAHNPEKVSFLTGMKLALENLQLRNSLVAEEAQRRAQVTDDSQEKAHLVRLADAMRRVPMKPARTFFEAVQCVWTMFLSTPDSLGRIDQYLYPYYCREMKAGTLNHGDALELLEELFVKVHETQVNNWDQPHSGHNHLVVGGYLQNGDDGWNELSELILDAIAELPTFRPQASFRYTDKTPKEIIRKIAAYNRRCPLIVFVNDEPRIKGMVNAGIAKEDAVEYTVLGCNEWAICGKSRLDLAHINMLHSLKELMWTRRSKALKAHNYEEFYREYQACLRADMERIVSDYDVFAREQAKDMNVMTSALMDSCIEKAQSFTDRGAKYSGLSMSFNGITNVTDSLSVIKHFVFDTHRFTMEQMLTALDDNWVGHEAMRDEILSNATFFGNDEPEADDILRALIDSIEEIRKTLKSEYANLIVCGSFVGATSPNIILARNMPATPDGRLAGEEMTMGISQSCGKDKEGITALLKSIAAPDYSKFVGCIVSNLKIDPKMADTQEKIDRIGDMFHAFLRLGGMQLQVNYLDNKELYDAQERPKEHENLMVRVTGYSGYFTMFDTSLQNDIIKRTEQECN